MPKRLLAAMTEFLRRKTPAQRMAIGAMVVIVVLSSLPIATPSELSSTSSVGRTRRSSGGSLITGALAATAAEDHPDFKKLLFDGNKLIVKGRSSYRDAIGKFTEALGWLKTQNVANGPSVVKALAPRAELFFMLKEWDSAMEDCNAVLKLDPYHRKALETRSKMLTSSGDFSGAAADYRSLYKLYAGQEHSTSATTSQTNDKKAKEHQKLADRLSSLGMQIQRIRSDLQRAKEAHRADIQAIADDQMPKEHGHQSAEHLLNAARRCVSVLKDMIAEFSKDNVNLRLERAECAILSRDHGAVAEEIKFVYAKESNNLKAMAISARAFRALGAMDRAKSDLKRCLSLDPEDPECSRLHKVFKTYQKHTEKVSDAHSKKEWRILLTLIDQSFKLEEDPPNIEQLWKWKCEAYVGIRDPEKGIPTCTFSITLEGGNDEKSPAICDTLLSRADLYLMQDDYDKAEQDVNKVREVNPQHEKIREYQQKIEGLKKNRDRKDYYKILGVSKTASEKDISRAYRKLAKLHHPDLLRSKEMTEKEREKADQRYRDINEAKEMLSDPEKRQRYDNGEDVTKPPGQQGGGGGFPGGGFPFPGGFPGFPGGGGGGFQFHFG